MSYRDSEAYVAGINDLLAGNPDEGIMSAGEKMHRGRVAVAELERFRQARDAGDERTMEDIRRKFDPSTEEGQSFLREYFAYFGYGYITSPEELVPDVPLLFYSFRVMVGAGTLMIVLFAIVWWLNRRDRLERRRWLLWIAIMAVPLAYMASQAGWIIAEVGRQPWAIQGMMPVSVAATDIGSASVATTFFIFLALFTLLLAAELRIMFKQIKIGPDKGDDKE